MYQHPFRHLIQFYLQEPIFSTNLTDLFVSVRDRKLLKVLAEDFVLVVLIFALPQSHHLIY